jgi:hypothetical protein
MLGCGQKDLARAVQVTDSYISQLLRRKKAPPDRVGGRSHEKIRVIVLEFLDTDLFQVSNESCSAFIDPLVESWNVDLDSSRIDIMLDRSLVAEPQRTFSFVEGRRPNKLYYYRALQNLRDPLHFSKE